MSSIKRIEKEINKEITIKVLIKGIKVDPGEEGEDLILL